MMASKKEEGETDMNKYAGLISTLILTVLLGVMSYLYFTKDHHGPRRHGPGGPARMQQALNKLDLSE